MKKYYLSYHFFPKHFNLNNNCQGDKLSPFFNFIVEELNLNQKIRISFFKKCNESKVKNDKFWFEIMPQIEIPLPIVIQHKKNERKRKGIIQNMWFLILSSLRFYFFF